MEPIILLCGLQDIEPGLEQSETFYSITYVVLFAGYSVAAVSVGLLFNHIPTWHLLFASTLCHTIAYLIYALAINGWMMIVARALAGLQLGAVTSLAFSYWSFSFVKYTENLKILGTFDEKKAQKAKGYLFSTSTFVNTGYALGLGKVTHAKTCLSSHLDRLALSY